MATPKWAAGHLYPPGSLVQPQTTPPPSGTVLTNPGFESGTTDWTLGPSMATDTANPFAGANALRCTGTAGWNEVVHDAVPVSPGTSISASCMYQQGGASTNQNTGMVFLRWYTSVMALISDSDGNLIIATEGDHYKQSSVTAAAPAGAAYVAIGGKTNRTHSDDSRFDNFAWNYGSYIVPSGLIYKAVQAATGYSDSDEPTWPLVLGVQVIDNEVTWEAVLANRVIWEASPILMSGATEPDWPTAIGEFVADNTISWEVISRRVEDENCPNTKVVAIMAAKVFAVDKDIVRFSATANPLDWSTEQDAGYLPTGLQQANANDMAVLAPYRSNLCPMNASSFQNWQVDPDPAAMAILDQMDGIGSVWQQAAQPVGNELFYLSQLGVRTVGIAAGAENLSAGDVGVPIDPLVREALAQAITDGVTIRSTYYPGAGQYWITFPNDDGTQVFVYTMTGKSGAWSRYLFPFAVDCFAQLGNDLYIRNGDVVSIVSEDAVADDVAGVPVEFTGTVQWPWLDFGQPGVTKMLEGFDIVSTGEPSVSIGYDQRNPAAYTPPYAVDPDTLPGGIIPLPVMGPTFSVKVDFAGGSKWQLQSVLLSFHDQANGP